MKDVDHGPGQSDGGQKNHEAEQSDEGRRSTDQIKQMRDERAVEKQTEGGQRDGREENGRGKDSREQAA